MPVMKICENCDGHGCAVCNDRGVIGEHKENAGCGRTKATWWDRITFLEQMRKLRDKHLKEDS